MVTRASTASPAKAPATAKTKGVARTKPVAKPQATPVKPSKPVARSKALASDKPAAKTVVAPSKPAPPAARKNVEAAKAVKPPASEEQRRNYIEVAAYYIAERRGFFGASALEDWTQAEAEVDRMLREGKLNP